MMWLTGMMSRRNSFVLLELILVILLVSIIAGFSSPRFRNSFASLKLKDTCFNIAKLANYAQEMAIVERANYKLNFDARSGKFWLSRDSLADEAVNYEKIKGDYGRQFSLPQGISFASWDKQVEVFFYPDGRLSQGQVKIVNRDGQARRIDFKNFGSQIEIKEIN